MSVFVNDSMNKISVFSDQDSVGERMSSFCYQLEDTAGICSPPLASPAGGQEQKTIAQMFEDVSHGLPPAISTLMFQSSLQSVKELAKVLVEFFKHGLSTNKLEVSMVLARQFSFHRNYPLALLSSVTSLARLSLARAELLVFAELVLQLCAELGAARGLLTSALVDVVLQWTRPRTNKRTEQLHARAALGLVRKVAVIICGDSRQSFQFLYHQLRARLLDASKCDDHEDTYGNFCMETKGILLDIIILMSRTRSSSSELEGEFELVSDLDVEPDTNNNHQEAAKNGTIQELNSSSVLDGRTVEEASRRSDVEVLRDPVTTETNANVATANVTTLTNVTSVTTVSTLTSPSRSVSSVKLLTPGMIEEDSKSFVATGRQRAMSMAARSCEVTPYQDPVDKILHSQREEVMILGYLNSPNGGYSLPVQNNSCIGKDPRCTVILEGREVSRLHARVRRGEAGVSLEPLSRSHRVTINGNTLEFGAEAVLMDNDTVQFGKETFTWNWAT